jgi:tetratricopeptide (TPR) repeat protein
MVFSRKRKIIIKGIIPVFLMTAGILFPAALCAAETINLDQNKWYVNRGFDKNWTTFGNAENDSSWRYHKGGPLRIRDIYAEKDDSVRSYTVLTYFDLSKDVTSSTEGMGLYLPGVGEAWQVFLNGRKIADEMYLTREGDIDIHRTVRGKLISFSPAVLKKGRNVLAIHLRGHSHFWGTGLYQYPGYAIDSYDKLFDEHNEYVVFLLIGIYAFIALLHFFIFFRRRSEEYNLYFAIFGILVFLYFLTRTDYILELVPWTNMVLRMEYIILFAIFPPLSAFLEDLFLKKVTWVTRGYGIFCALLMAAVPLLPLSMSVYALYVWQGSAFIAIGYFIYLFVKGYKNRVPEVRALTAALFILVSTATFDILDFIVFHTGFAFSKYGILAFAVGTVIILSNKLMRVYGEVEDLNVNLEQKVQERTSELARSLDELAQLKHQQDGDYYLTSRIMKFLGRNTVRSKNIVINEITRQNKSLLYEDKNVEVGGDLNVSSTIHLGGAQYIAFFNCSAHGTSIQGAGGALVAGAIYNTLINRFDNLQDSEESNPELWLARCFMDLNRVFSIFDGAITASCVIGLVDETRGYCYYINAGNQSMVLYRHNHSNVVNVNFSEKSLGSRGIDPLNGINTLQMLPGDNIIIAGSGVVKGMHPDDFEAVIEESKGDIRVVYDKISTARSLDDDCSLFSFLYKPEHPFSPLRNADFDNLPRDIKDLIGSAALAHEKGDRNRALSLLRTAKEKTENNPAILVEIIRLYVKDKKYEIASDLAEQFSLIAPDNEELLYLSSYAAKMAGQYRRAVDFGQRYFLRQPNNARNLFNLADAWRLDGNVNRASDILEKGLLLDGNDVRALQLKELLESTEVTV